MLERGTGMPSQSTTPAIADESKDDEVMSCMEVWGGSQAMDNGVVMSGLNAWIISHPYEGSDRGGDVHYVSSCATGRITRVLLADVSGHGQAVADLAHELRGLMRRYINYLDQTRLVQSINEAFSEVSREGIFATAVVVTYWGPTNTMVITNAGHPPPLLYRSSTQSWELLEESSPHHGIANIPLGVEGLAEYSQFGFKLRSGDLVLLYTDALFENTGLSPSEVTALVEDLGADDPNALIHALAERAAGDGDIASIADDLTLMAFGPNATNFRVPIGDRVLAPFRVGWGIIRGLIDRTRGVPWPEMTRENILGSMFSAPNQHVKLLRDPTTGQADP